MHNIVLIFILACPCFIHAQNLADNTNNNLPVSVSADGDNKPTPVPLANEDPKKVPLHLVPWQKAEDQTNGSISRISLAKLKAANTSLVSFLKDSCLADSTLHPMWHGEYTADKKAATPNLSYGIRCNFTQSSVLSIMANDIGPLLRHIEVYGQDYTALVAIPTVRNECPHFEPGAPLAVAAAPAAATPTTTAAKTKLWLVTARPDELPYTVLTRKDYLEKVIASLNTVKQHIIADVKQKAPTRTTADQEAQKNKDLESFRTTYTGAELEMRQRTYLQHYKSDEDYQKEKIDAATADTDSTISFIDGMLHHLSPATLAAPAIVSPTAKEFEGFADAEPGSVMLVGIKPAAVDATATPEKPNFFLVTWNFNPADPASASLDREIARKLDPRILKNILKK
jgi:hypothetical protein